MIPYRNVTGSLTTELTMEMFNKLMDDVKNAPAKVPVFLVHSKHVPYWQAFFSQRYDAPPEPLGFKVAVGRRETRHRRKARRKKEQRR